MAGFRNQTIGIALGVETAVAVFQGPGGGPRARASGDFRPRPGRDPDADLLTAFQELKVALEAGGSGSTDGAKVHLTLLPPLADTRLLSFPPMHKEEIQTVLTRDASRYFLGANQETVVGIHLQSRRGNGPGAEGELTAPVLASAASLGLLEGVQSALAEVGWRSGSFSSAEGVWLSSVQDFEGAPAEALVTLVGGSAHIWRLEGGAPRKTRQLPASDPNQIAETLGIGPGRVVLLSPDEDRDRLREALIRGGWDVLPAPKGGNDPHEAAASRAGPGGIQLVPPTLVHEKKKRRRKDALLFLLGAVVLLVGSAGAQLWGANRELRVLQERRASIRQEVTPLLLARDSLMALGARVEALRELERSAPVWTRSLVELTAALPGDIYLTSFFASGDTLELEAAGTGAGEAIQLLRNSGLFQDLRLQGVVEREMEGGETVLERFRLRGLLPALGKGGGS